MRLSLSFLLCFCYLTGFAQDNGRTVRIPVIFHVLYRDSTADNGINTKSIHDGNSSQYLPTTKLLAELKNLSEDFMGLNADQSMVLATFKPIIGNPKIEFYLADTILQKGGEKGIIRKKTVNNVYRLYEQSKIIDSRRFLNVYIGNIKNSKGQFTDGYVNSSGLLDVCDPWHWPTSDAIYLRYKWVGLGYRLLTHETGHWLGLWHIFEGGCQGEGDMIGDTPPQRGATDGDCVYCPNGGRDQSCSSNSDYNYNNFMDYSGCRKMFTNEQVKVMRKVIMDYRTALWR